MKSENPNKITNFMVAVILSILISFSNLSLKANAYWGELIPDAVFQNVNSSGLIGVWNFGGTISPPNGVIVVEDNENGIVYGNNVVYYNGELIYITGYSINRDFVTMSYPDGWNTHYFGWKWFPYVLYQPNQAIIHNGRIYLAADADVGSLVGNLHTPETAQFWDLVGSIEWMPDKAYRAGKTYIVEYEGQLYRSKWYYKGTVPPSQNSAFELLTNTAYTAGQSYNAGRVVRYNGGVYIALKNTTAAPETARGNWNRLDSPVWSQFNQYNLHDVAAYNGNYYQVVNANSANSPSPPGAVPYAWNQIDTYDYNPKNIYKLNHLVIYNNTVYRSLKNNNTDAIANTNSWVKYIS